MDPKIKVYLQISLLDFKTKEESKFVNGRVKFLKSQKLVVTSQSASGLKND